MKKNVSLIVQEIIAESRKEASLSDSPYVGTEHLLLGILSKSNRLTVKVLMLLGVDIDALETTIKDNDLQENAVVDKEIEVDQLPFSQQAELVIKEMFNEAHIGKNEEVHPHDLLLTILKHSSNTGAKILNNVGINYEKYRAEVSAIIDAVKDATSESIYSSIGRGMFARPIRDPSNKLALDQFLICDISQLAKEDYFTPLVGREVEIEQILQIFCRRKKNNVILLGEQDTDKRSIVEELARRIVQNKVPPALRNIRIVELNLLPVTMNANYIGELQENIMFIIQELKNYNVIAFINEIDTIIGMNSKYIIDLVNIIKPALLSGDLWCIGTSTPEKYNKYIEASDMYNDYFKRVVVSSISVETTIDMLKNIKLKYETFHHVTYADDAIEASVKLSHYIKEGLLPGKAIDILDEVGAAMRLKIPRKIRQSRISNIKKQQIYVTMKRNLSVNWNLQNWNGKKNVKNLHLRLLNKILKKL